MKAYDFPSYETYMEFKEAPRAGSYEGSKELITAIMGFQPSEDDAEREWVGIDDFGNIIIVSGTWSNQPITHYSLWGDPDALDHIFSVWKREP